MGKIVDIQEDELVGVRCILRCRTELEYGTE